MTAAKFRIFAPMKNKKLSVEAMLAGTGISELNEMQQRAAETIHANQNTILLSGTGTGKTLAYLLPLAQQLDASVQKTQALIILPSRELALQTEKVFKQLQTGFKVTSCYGGHLRETEENNLLEAPALIVGTPGRLCDHLRRGNISTAAIRVLVLDEFDKSAELGFQDEISFIVEQLKALDKRVLISATDAAVLPAFLQMDPAEKLDFHHLSDNSEKLWIRKLSSPEKDKIETLFRLLCFANGRPSIVFCNHREAVERTSTLLKDKGIQNVYYHGAMEQRERETALCKFSNGSSPTLVTTDLASRGLDIPNIRYIIHYHLPHTEEAYTHRNGRTARMHASGTVVLLLGPDETLPSYIAGDPEEMELPEAAVVPEKPKWTTLFISAGKKDKINKIDIVGFLSHKAGLKKEDIGLIEVKDFFSFAAVRKSKAGHALKLVENQKIKGQKVKISFAK